MGDDRFHLTGVERTFAADTFIVSKTDKKGIITYANDVFLDIADYTMDEVLGKPHNMIRHPGMPRCIFKTLWTQIAAGKEIFAYVVNRTKFGDHYWVFAHVTPSFDANGAIVGYHSNRRAPKPETIAIIQPFYSRLRSIEDSASNVPTGVEMSCRELKSWIDQNGGNYDELILSL